MTLNSILYSGFTFDGNEDLLQFKFKMLNSIFIIVAFFSALFGILSDLGIHDIGPIHSKVNYAYSISMIVLIFFSRSSKKYYELTAHTLLITSLITFTSSLIFVPQDEFRMIWFYLLIFVAYIISGKTSGMLYTIASIVILLTTNFFVELYFSQTAIISSVLGLIVGSFLAYTYTNKITQYENNLKQQNSTLRVLASTDHLTGIINRRIFNEISKHYFETAQKDHLNLTLLLLDLDHFKNINDTYGHQVGDDLLIQFVETIKKILTKGDIFARIGGEEFAILLSQMDRNDAYALAEKIRKEVENISMKHKGQNVFVRTSIGITQNSIKDSSFDDVFSRSDMALYQAKKEGRNRTCCAPISNTDIECPNSKKHTKVLNFSI